MKTGEDLEKRELTTGLQYYSNDLQIPIASYIFKYGKG